MMRTVIPFERETGWQTLGRNGYSQAHGIEVSMHAANLSADEALDEVWLEPINSRGQTARCRVVVPKAALPALIEALQRIADAP